MYSTQYCMICRGFHTIYNNFTTLFLIKWIYYTTFHLSMSSVHSENLAEQVAQLDQFFAEYNSQAMQISGEIKV